MPTASERMSDETEQRASDRETLRLMSRIEELETAALRAAAIIDANLYHQREKVTDASSLLKDVAWRQAGNTRRRKPQDATLWPPDLTPEQIEACIDNLCGCGGIHACDCVSVFNKSCSTAWFEHNSKPKQL